MKISSPISKASDVQSAGTAGTGRKHTTSNAPASGPARSDDVQLSGLGAQLAGSASQSAKLSQLADAVTTGRYRPDAYAVSGSIIQHSLAAAAAF